MAGGRLRVITLDSEILDGLLAKVEEKDRPLIDALPYHKVKFDVVPKHESERLENHTPYGVPLRGTMMRIGKIRDAKGYQDLFALLFKRKDSKCGLPTVKLVKESTLGFANVDIKSVVNKPIAFRQEFYFISTQKECLNALVQFYFFKHDYEVSWEVDFERCGRSFAEKLRIAATEYNSQQRRNGELNYGAPSAPGSMVFPGQEYAGYTAPQRSSPVSTTPQIKPEVNWYKQVQSLDTDRSDSSTSGAVEGGLDKWEDLLKQGQSLREKRTAKSKALIECEQSEMASKTRIESLKADLKKEEEILRNVRTKAQKLRNEESFIAMQRSLNKNEREKVLASLTPEMRKVYALACQDVRQTEDEEDDMPLGKRRRVEGSCS